MGVSSARFYMYSVWYNVHPLEINVIGTVAVANGTIYISGWDWVLNLISDYSVYNTTFVCDKIAPEIWLYPYSCDITCAETNSSQFFTIDKSCENCTIDKSCNIIENVNDIDNVTRGKVDQIFILVNEFEQTYDNECNRNDSMTFDIGYPKYGELFIVNDYYGGSVCCRGAESCAYSRTIYSNLGNIFCTGEFSCGESESVWTSDYVEALDENRQVTIFCMAYASCFGTRLESADRIICGVYSSCERAEIGAQRLYCVYDACSNTILRGVHVAYIYDLQTEMTIYSGNIGTMTTHFIGKDAGTDVDFTCSEGDECFVICGENACSNDTTILTCYGKCFVTCDGIEDNKDCVNIEYSDAPTIAPSDPPATITHEDVGTWFNWVLWSVIGIVAFMVIVGYGDAKKLRKNELFEWNAILSFGFYSIDFFSDLFFSMKLYLFMIDDSHNIDEYQLIYTLLFCFSIAFIFIPLLLNLFQLHNELSKWLIDPILSRTEAPVWILSFMRLLYLVSIISGSSFSAIALFNSNLFQLRVFGMGLSRYHQKMFAHKRFFSVVLLEVCTVYWYHL